MDIMENELILAKVAARLPQTDLLNLRSTCDLWNRQFIACLRQPIRLRSNLGEFVELMRNSQLIPFQHYILGADADPTPIQPTERGQNVDDFVAVCGHAVRRLEIKPEIEASLGVNGVRHLLFDGQLPNLADLRLSTSELKEKDDGAPPPTDFRLQNLKKFSFCACAAERLNPAYRALVCEVIRSAAPNLEVLCLYTWSNSSLEWNALLQAVLTELSEGEAAPNLRKLRSLKFKSDLKAPHLQVLVEMATRVTRGRNALRLQTFYALTASDSETQMFLTEFLTAQASTLRKLTIQVRDCWTDSIEQPLIRLPPIGCLHTLRYAGQEASLEGRLEDDFPRLQQLGLTHPGFNPPMGVMGLHAPNERQPAHSRVTDLISMIHVSELASFSTRFPAVTRAFLTVTYWYSFSEGDPLDCSVIWRIWPQLVTLQLEIMVKDLEPDALLTGVPPSALPHLARELATGDLTLADLRIILQQHKTESSISDLVHLREFTWRSRTIPEFMARLTDIGVFFGLALAGPNLKHVTISEREGNPVSLEAMKFLRTALEPGNSVELKRIA